ncbi:Alpha/Beta hydrolase protein [Podospora aff. communis PSN243]|uniref:Alpha/Beta hydrolase protein n=1 Tax=Podospora aff. communis PSN243 TaxID=3040156 RepID=A0AAV9GH50_9PEZI|nr:Alpha/Beta hydrolase protein [Podospora aff. communis PSN243]
MEKIAHQPLHPSIRNVLEPEYVALHDSILQYVVPTQAQEWDPASRSRPSPVAHCAPKLVEVGSIYDKDVNDFQIRVFTPSGNPPANGWPALVWYHGGGWVNGGLNSENAFLTHVCKCMPRANVQCVVISVNYRHAPEHAYPAATNDAFAGLQWVLAPENSKALGIDAYRVAIGGLSAGGGLAASVGLRHAQLSASPKLLFQVLICPVIDNLATTSTVWSTSQNSPFLTPARMSWYRDRYFQSPNSEADRGHWRASPCYAPSEVLDKSADTFIGIAECDLLAPEDLAYAEQLRSQGVKVESKVYKGATHSVLILAGALKSGKELTHDACEALSRALGTSYNRDAAPVVGQDS